MIAIHLPNGGRVTVQYIPGFGPWENVEATISSLKKNGQVFWFGNHRNWQEGREALREALGLSHKGVCSGYPIDFKMPSPHFERLWREENFEQPDQWGHSLYDPDSAKE
jgi:hypothetical protein